tara:strand:- start:1388 stop:3163 length:1776 start_codon:yes stop_codon:yes gene_type:complete
MCGICGEIRFNKSKTDSVKAEHMMQSIKSRGPDNKGLYLHNNIFLGHRRLSIIDVSDKSNQPLIDKKLNLIVVFNGVIYNYKDLRKTLIKKGYEFFTEGDTEIILKSYHCYGDSFVEKLDGVFAFCIYDMTKNLFFASRDRFGIKPFYYSINDNCFTFASNTQALITNKHNKINSQSLNYQLNLHSVIPAPNTILSDIYKLEPGYYLKIYPNKEFIKTKYYSIENISINYNLSENEILEQTENLLIKSIKKRLLTSDVPVGVLLSGGLDSSLIVAMAAKNKMANINTFSIGFSTIEEEMGNEFYYSNQVAKEFGTNHHKYLINDNDLYDNLDSVIAMMPEPMVSQDASAFFLLAKQVSKIQKVVLSGQGADELFGGYFWYNLMNRAKGSDYQKFSQHYFDRDYDDYKLTINKEYIESDYSKMLLKSLFSKYDDTNLGFLDKVLRIDISKLIIDDPVKRVDSMTMSWGLETRVPFLDFELIEFLLSVGSENKIVNNGKYYLKKIAKKYLDEDLIDRKKYYFPVPPLKIIKDRFYDYVREILLSPQCINRNIFNRKNIDYLLEKPNDHFTKLNGNKLWHLALLERWFQLNVDK